MGAGDRVADEDILLRRFNPAERSHYWFDQEGVGEKHFKSGGLSYKPDGFSVYQDSKLIVLAVERSVVLENPGWKIAGTTAAHVRSLERGGKKLLDAIENPIPVDDEGDPVRNLAHALIVLPEGTNGSQISAWAKKLAKELVELSLVR